MLIYLKYDKSVKVVEDISLQHGFIPVVGDSPPSIPGSNEPFQLDPSLWYKTLVVGAVYIDCNERDVRWTRPNNGDETEVKCLETNIRLSVTDKFFPENAQRLHSNIDVYDFDPTQDEFLDQATSVMAQYTGKTITQQQFIVQVVRILHCFILPLLQFNQLDTVNLADVFAFIENQHEQMELILLNKTEEWQCTENALQKQRERILLNEDFDSEKYAWSCNRVFLALFLNHVEKDINNVSLELDELSVHINTLKMAIPENDAQKYTLEQSLIQHRESRDKVFEWLVKLQTVRETIKNVICRPMKTKKNKYKKIKVKENVIHNIYEEIATRMKIQKDDIQSTIMKKVKLSSVREAVYGALLALERSKEVARPFETSDGSEYSLKIIGFEAKPADWDTLEEKVLQQLSDRDSNIYAEHVLCIQRIEDLIQASVNEISMFGLQIKPVDNDWMLLPSQPRCRMMNSFDVSRKSMKRRSVRCSSGIDNLSSNSIKSAVENIKEVFITHMDNICDMLIESIPNCTPHKNKIWVSYEAVFSPECLPHLVNLYEQSLSATCQIVHKVISTFSLCDIMNEDEGFLKLLHIACSSNNEHAELDDVRSPSIASSNDRPASNASLISVEIKKCTLGELYSMANKDCSALEKQFSVHTADQVDMLNGVEESASSSSTDRTSSEEGDADDELDETSCLAGASLEDVDYKTMLSDTLSSSMEMLQTFLKSKTILDKLRKLTHVYREVGEILTKLMGSKGMVCCDEMLSMLIVLLWCLDQETFLKIYTNINMLIDLMPDFLIGNVHDCSLTNFYAAYQMLFDSECLYRKKASLTDVKVTLE